MIPTWDVPDIRQVRSLASITVQFVRFLKPEIVNRIVQNNERHRQDWTNRLNQASTREIDANDYLWEKCAVAFPGIRRHIGREETKWKGKMLQDGPNSTKNTLLIDDNDYPKQLWSYIFTGVEFRKQGPKNYSLAHLTDSKQHNGGNQRHRHEFEIVGEEHNLFGLFTSAANSVYIYDGLMKPTDCNLHVRNLLLRKAQQLYGDFCEILPPWLKIKQNDAAEWYLNEFKWADPVGEITYIDKFLEFRMKKMEKLFDQYVSLGETTTRKVDMEERIIEPTNNATQDYTRRNGERIGEYVRRVLEQMLRNSEISQAEISQMQTLEYSTRSFGIQFPLLKHANGEYGQRPLRYWGNPVFVYGNYYFICSEWYERPENNDYLFFAAWLDKRMNK